MNTRNNVLARIFGSHEQTDELSGEGGEVTFPLTDEPNQAEIDATQAAWLREAIEERRRAQRNGGAVMTLIEHNEVRTQRKRNGQFAKGNTISKRGGHARAKALTPRRRRQIARQGWRGLVAKKFNGDERAAKLWWGALGAWNYDQQLFALGWIMRGVFPHPGTPAEFRAQLYQSCLFDPMNREPDFYGKVRQ